MTQYILLRLGLTKLSKIVLPISHCLIVIGANHFDTYGFQKIIRGSL